MGCERQLSKHVQKYKNFYKTMVEADIVEKLQEEIQYEKRLPT
jgi:hypothetical protein